MPRPENVGVGIAVVILDRDGRVLLLRRSGAHAAGRWSVPGGWVDAEDASLLDAVRREAREEVEVEVVEAHQVGATTEYHEDLGVRTVTVYFLCGAESDMGDQATAFATDAGPLDLPLLGRKGSYRSASLVQNS